MVTFPKNEHCNSTKPRTFESDYTIDKRWELKHSLLSKLVTLKILTLYSLYIQETILHIKEKYRCITNDQ
jgi:hypothetical protein